jgi:ribA/ribD-fused uncharacterized protein
MRKVLSTSSWPRFWRKKMEEISFTKVALPYGWLGNMSPHGIEYNDLWYRTGEALFQVLRFDDIDVRSGIQMARSPMQAKMIAKVYRSKMVITPRSQPDLANMRLVLKLKFDQHPELQTLLLETGDALLIEDCSARMSESALFWGRARQGARWIGEGWLGTLLMERRTALRDAHG